jgi:RNA polymerase sigma-70 factor (ECF subfamily)
MRGRRAPDRALQQQAPVAGPTGAHVALMAALARLPEAQRRVLVLHHVCDLSVQHVAAEVGVPEGTVKVRLLRGRAALRGLLGDDDPTDHTEGVTPWLTGSRP